MKTKRSLMTRYCLGGDLEFEGIPCEHILEPSRECELLKTSTIGVFFSSEKRCLSWRILLDMVRKRLRAYKKTYRYLDAIDDLNIGGLISRLAGSRVKGPPNIYSLRSLVKVAVHRAIRWRLDELQLLPARRECGTCRHLSISKPRMCKAQQVTGRCRGSKSSGFCAHGGGEKSQ